MLLKHCMHHKLEKEEATEILLDLICEWVSDYVSHVISAERGNCQNIEQAGIA